MIHQTALVFLALLPCAAAIECIHYLEYIKSSDGSSVPVNAEPQTCSKGFEHCAHTGPMSVADFRKLDADKEDVLFSTLLNGAKSITSSSICASSSDCNTIKAVFKTNCDKETGNCCTNTAVASSVVMAALVAALGRFALSN